MVHALLHTQPLDVDALQQIIRLAEHLTQLEFDVEFIAASHGVSLR